MYYCSDVKLTWATPTDLYERFGDEFVDNLSTRRNYDKTLGRYVADERPEARLRVVQLALDDARAMIVRKLQCKYNDVVQLNTLYFPSIKQWHIKLAIETLQMGGDCSACACNADLDKYLDCNSICTEDGICLTSKSTFISASEAHFKCECIGSCGCC